jgi:rubrerythrin
MNTKDEILSHLREMLKMENQAHNMYSDLASSVEAPALKNFLLEIAEEEKGHGKIVGDLINLIGKD